MAQDLVLAYPGLAQPGHTRSLSQFTRTLQGGQQKPGLYVDTSVAAWLLGWLAARLASWPGCLPAMVAGWLAEWVVA